MANTIQLKRSSVPGKIPDAGNVNIGEPLVNLADLIIYTKDTFGNVKVIGAGVTSNITEGTNLYFTNARVSTAISDQTLINATFSADVTVANLTSEGNVKAHYYYDGYDRSLFIRDANGVIVWGD